MAARQVASGALVGILLSLLTAATASAAPTEVVFSEVDHPVVGGHAAYLDLEPASFVEGSVAVHHFLLGIGGKLDQADGGCGQNLATAIPPPPVGGDLRSVLAEAPEPATSVVTSYYCISTEQALRVSTTLLVFLSGVNASQQGLSIDPLPIPLRSVSLELAVDPSDPSQAPERPDPTAAALASPGADFTRIGPSRSIGSGDGRIWAITVEGIVETERLVELDPVTRQELNSVDVSDIMGRAAPLVVGNTVWVGHGTCSTCPVRVLHTRTLEELAAFDLNRPIEALVYHDGVIWGSGHNEIIAIDPIARKVIKRIPLQDPTPPVVAQGRLWTFETDTGMLHEIDTSTATIADSHGVGSGSADFQPTFDAIGGLLWIKAGGSLVVADPEDGAVIADHSVATTPIPPTRAGDRVWVNGTDELLGIPISGAGAPLVVATDGLWIGGIGGELTTAPIGASEVQRFDPVAGAALGTVELTFVPFGWYTEAYGRLWFTSISAGLISYTPGP